MIGAGYIDGSIMLDFDLKHTLVNATGGEKLKVEVFNGSEWIEVAEFVNNESIDWESRSIDITEPAKGNIFKVRFTAHGIATADIFNWMIDNIRVYRKCAAPINLIAISFLWDGIQLFWESPDSGEAWIRDGSGKYLNVVQETENTHNVNKPKSNIKPDENENLTKSNLNREFLGYLIYRDGELIASTTELNFLDPCPELESYSTYYYEVTALYDDCESDPSVEWIYFKGCDVGVTYQDVENLKVYPNPSTGLFYIDTEGLEGKLSVYSFTGKLLIESGLNRSETQTISLSNYPPGAYLVKFVADSGETFTGKVIIAR
jgi:hypothetical protein